MIDIPPELLVRFDLALKKKSLSDAARFQYRKWLRYYLDFCHKYGRAHAAKESLFDFIKKLREKHQSPAQCEQASHAISLYFELSRPASSAEGPTHKTPERKAFMVSEPWQKTSLRT
jgi:hypothetical protein